MKLNRLRLIANAVIIFWTIFFLVFFLFKIVSGDIKGGRFFAGIFVFLLFANGALLPRIFDLIAGIIYIIEGVLLFLWYLYYLGGDNPILMLLISIPPIVAGFLCIHFYRSRL